MGQTHQLISNLSIQMKRMRTWIIFDRSVHIGLRQICSLEESWRTISPAEKACNKILINFHKTQEIPIVNPEVNSITNKQAIGTTEAYREPKEARGKKWDTASITMNKSITIPKNKHIMNNWNSKLKSTRSRHIN